MIDNLLTIKEVANLLRVSVRTLERWDDAGKLPAIKTIGGHRRYKQGDIDAFLGNESEKPEKTVCIYGRVSSHEQKAKGDLDRQCQRLSEYCVKKKYKVGHILKDVGSGLSDLRRGFNKLVELVIAGKVNVLVIEHKDRLTRFHFNVLEKFFNSYGVTIECVDQPDKDSETDRSNRHGEKFKCQVCGLTGNADINAALNILGRFLTGKYGSCYKPLCLDVGFV